MNNKNGINSGLLYATRIIPTDYFITAIAVGMNKGPDILWREYFRPNRF